MANSYFRFRQFTIHQEHCAMKVCTDACLFGAWVAEKASAYERILDIGSGTGLLMMMVAQQSKAMIHGIEIDPFCYGQLQQNIEQNEWSEKLKAFHGDIRRLSLPVRYDLIISNPPFYEKDLHSETEGTRFARHSIALTFTDLLESIKLNLTRDGSFAVLLPYHRWEYFNGLAQTMGFFLSEKIEVRQTENHSPFRAMLWYDSEKKETVSNGELTIKIQQKYSPDFRNLLKDYYLEGKLD